MFPWLPFLTFPDSSRRKRRLQVYLPTQNESNSILCSVEVFTKIPDKEIEIHLAPTPTRLSNRSISSSPVPSTSSKSPRSGSGLASSRPPSARDKKPLFAPPIEPKPSRNQRKGLETSSAMLELFGGTQPLIQITSSKEEEKEKIKKPEEPLKEIINVEAKENIEQNLPTKSTEIEQPSQQISDVYKSTGITACFETISHPDLSNKNYARKNVLERETFVPSEWETIKTHPSTSSTFQVRIINSSSIEQMFDEKNNTDWLAWLLSICFAIYFLDIAIRAGLHGRRILDNRRS
uniref:Uncharacterized protein n=1 Tax=Panagrolaimus davidi TaxID=227884 RepID=A0A914QEW1_9BILA